MTPAQINRELERLDREGSRLNSELIDAGRGHEKPTTTRTLSDPLSLAWQQNVDRMAELQREVARRWGPGFVRAPVR